MTQGDELSVKVMEMIDSCPADNSRALLRCAVKVIDLVRIHDEEAARAYSKANVVLVRDRMHVLKIRYTKHAAWRIGLAAANKWMKMNNGVQPRKQNHVKTSGKGVHCLAEYPESFKPYIDTIISNYETLSEAQMDLWGDPI